MEHGPLPPHERTWRHPSELAAQEHALARAETTAATTRMFAFTTGTLGLLAVGLLMLAVTPNRSVAPVAISVTTTPAALGGSSTAVTPAVTQPTDSSPIALRGRPEAFATPIGEGRFAVVTAADLFAAAGAATIGKAIEVQVPSGRVHAAHVVGRAGDAVLIELERNEPGVDVADEHPGGHEIVTVLAEPPVTIMLDDLPTLDVDEGTAVLDGDGELLGLCSQDPDHATRLLVVSDDLLGDATSGDATSGDGVDARGDIRDDSIDDDSLDDSIDDDTTDAGGPGDGISDEPVGATTDG